MGVVIQMGSQAKDVESEFAATSCYRVNANSVTEGEGDDDGSKVDIVKRIVLVNHYPKFEKALKALNMQGALAAAGVDLQFDVGPESRAKKTVENQAFKGAA